MVARREPDGPPREFSFPHFCSLHLFQGPQLRSQLPLQRSQLVVAKAQSSIGSDGAFEISESAIISDLLHEPNPPTGFMKEQMEYTEHQSLRSTFEIYEAGFKLSSAADFFSRILIRTHSEREEILQGSRNKLMRALNGNIVVRLSVQGSEVRGLCSDLP